MRGGGRLGAAASVCTCVLAAVLVSACSPNDPPGGSGRLSVATGGAGGVYQVYGGALADLYTQRLGTPTTAETTSASVDNLTLLAKGSSDVAFTLGDTAIDAVRGRGSFAGRQPVQAIARIYPNITQVVVPADSGIRRIEDLKGKGVSIGAPNSGTEVIALRLLAVAGLDPERDIDSSGLGVGESVAALRDGTIDAFLWSGGVPTGAVTDLATTDEIRLLDLSPYLSKMQARYGDAYIASDVDKGEYTGVPATKTIGVPNLLMVPSAMSEELAFRVTKALFDGKAELAKVAPQAESLDPEQARESVPPVPLHPGARRYYAQAGGGGSSAAAATIRRAAATVAPARVAGADQPRRVVARDRTTGRIVASLPLTPDGTFSLRYRHSVLHAAGEERYAAARDGRGFELRALASPSQGVLDYYETTGTRVRERGGTWVETLGRPRRYAQGLPLAATPVGRRTLVSGGRAVALWPRDGAPAAHLRITVEAAR